MEELRLLNNLAIPPSDKVIVYFSIDEEVTNLYSVFENSLSGLLIIDWIYLTEEKILKIILYNLNKQPIIDSVMKIFPNNDDGFIRLKKDHCIAKIKINQHEQ